MHPPQVRDSSLRMFWKASQGKKAPFLQVDVLIPFPVLELVGCVLSSGVSSPSPAFAFLTWPKICQIYDLASPWLTRVVLLGTEWSSVEDSLSAEWWIYSCHQEGADDKDIELEDVQVLEKEGIFTLKSGLQLRVAQRYLDVLEVSYGFTIHSGEDWKAHGWWKVAGVSKHVWRPGANRFGWPDQP